MHRLHGEADALKVAVVGCGRMGEHHVRAARSLPGVEVVAVVDTNERAVERLRDTLGIPHGFSTVEELLAGPKVDVVNVVTPPGTHESVAKPCLEHGIHIYVEKPFAERSEEAESILSLASEKDLKVCAGHQLLFERATERATELLPGIGQVVHVDSFFSFRPSRPADGRPPVGRIEQLLDILPHPTYLLDYFLPAGRDGSSLEIVELLAEGRGEVRALVRGGPATGSLVVTLSGRPVDSFVRVVGTRGTLRVDYVRGVVFRSFEGGTIAKLLEPYLDAFTGVIGTTRSIGGRLLKRQRFYPGLAEALARFYDSVRHGTPSPVAPTNIMKTVELCERARSAILLGEAQPTADVSSPPTVAVTGGTGFLGVPIVQSLVKRGITPLVLSRRLPPTADRLRGAIYRTADLGDADALKELPASIDTVIHAAAETVGGWEAHERNSVEATRRILRAMAERPGSRFVYVSSIAVISQRAREPITSDAPTETDGRSRGPYVWGKLTGEREAQTLGAELGVGVKVVRPSALIDLTDFSAPGKLGRQLGPLFVAVGRRSDPLGVIDVRTVADILAWMVDEFDSAPDVMNLTDPQGVTRGDLVGRLRQGAPGMRVVWLPWVAVHLLNWMLWPVQKLLRPGRPAISLPAAFRSPRYASDDVSALLDAMSDVPNAAPTPVGELAGSHRS